MSVASATLMTALSAGCSLMLDVANVRPRPDVILPDAGQLDADRSTDAQVDVRRGDASRDITRIDRLPQPDAIVQDATLPPDEVVPVDAVVADAAALDGIAVDDYVPSLDAGAADTITARDGTGGVDVPPAPDASLTDVHVTTCGRAVPPYACPSPTTCAAIESALAAATLAATSIPCCDSADCDAVFSNNLCCANEAVEYGYGTVVMQS
ncbi:MAG: hypothetical protein WCJ30_19380, partial [Deltaproteobacteria bacterium]